MGDELSIIISPEVYRKLIMRFETYRAIEKILNPDKEAKVEDFLVELMERALDNVK